MVRGLRELAEIIALGRVPIGVCTYLGRPDAPEWQQLDAAHGARVEDEQLHGGERTDG